MSEGWSVSQKEAIREKLNSLAYDFERYDSDFIANFGDRIIERALEQIEAITKGDEQ